MPGRTPLIQKQRMRVKPQAEEFTPAERIRLRALMRQLEQAPVVDEYLDCPAVADKLGLSTRTVRDLANDGAFDGVWGRAWKPQHNRLKIPSRGVQAFIEARAARVVTQTYALEPANVPAISPKL